MAERKDDAVHPLFRAAALQVGWARDKLKELDDGFGRYAKFHVASRIAPADPPAAATYIVAAAHTPFPTALLVGDICHHLRLGLDYALGAAAAQAAGLDQPPVQAYFPIEANDHALLAAFERRLKPLGLGPLRAFLTEEIRPTRRGNYPLWALDQLDRINQIRPLRIEEAVRVPTPVDETGAPPSGLAAFVLLRPGSTARIALPGAFRPAPVQKRDRIFLARFEERDLLPGATVIPSLKDLLGATVDVLSKLQEAYLRAFEPPGP